MTLQNLLSLFSGMLFDPDDSAGAAPPDTPPGHQTGREGDPPADSTPPSTTGTAPGDQRGQQEGEGDGDDALPRTLDDLNRRIAKAQRSGVRRLLADLGFENLAQPDALQAAQRELADLVQFAREQRQAQAEQAQGEQTALERAQAQIDALRKQVEAAEQRAAELEQARRNDRRDAAILAAARHATDPSDVLAWAKTDGQQHLETVLDDAGEVVAEQIEALVQACRQAKPHYFRSGGPGSPSNAGGKPPQPDKDLIEQHRRQQAALYHF